MICPQIRVIWLQIRVICPQIREICAQISGSGFYKRQKAGGMYIVPAPNVGFLYKSCKEIALITEEKILGLICLT